MLKLKFRQTGRRPKTEWLRDKKTTTTRGARKDITPLRFTSSETLTARLRHLILKKLLLISYKIKWRSRAVNLAEPLKTNRTRRLLSCPWLHFSVPAVLPRRHFQNKMSNRRTRFAKLLAHTLWEIKLNLRNSFEKTEPEEIKMFRKMKPENEKIFYLT